MSRVETYESGSFKDVEVYDNYVIKRAKREYDEYEDTYNDCYESESEMIAEYNYYSRKKHLPISLKILSGYELEFSVPRAKVIEDFESIEDSEFTYKICSANSNLFKLKKKKVMRAIRKVAAAKKIKVVYDGYFKRLDDIILFGMRAKLSDQKIVQSCLWFFIEHIHNNLLSDLHSRNLGVYKGNIVLIDAGAVNTTYDFRNKYNIKKYTEKMRENTLRSGNRFKKLKSNKHYQDLLSYKNKKIKIVVVDKDQCVKYDLAGFVDFDNTSVFASDNGYGLHVSVLQNKYKKNRSENMWVRPNDKLVIEKIAF